MSKAFTREDDRPDPEPPKRLPTALPPGAKNYLPPGGETARYRIVGVDEVDVARGWISWVSPVANALLSAAVGDRVRAALPSGEKELEEEDLSCVHIEGSCPGGYRCSRSPCCPDSSRAA